MFLEMLYNIDVINHGFVVCEEENSYEKSNENNSSDNIISDYIDYMLFSLQIDDVIDKNYSKRDAVIVLNNTPKLLTDVGIPNLPITITQKHIYTIINKNGKYKNVNYHGLGKEIIKQIPNSIKTPLYILKSQTRDDSILVITKLKDKYCRPIVVSIKINGKGQIKNIQINANVMTSVYGRNNYNKFIENNILLDNLLYDYQKGTIKKLDTADRKQ